MSEKDTPSPDGRYVATVFEISCYNTTGNTPHVHLRRAGQKRGKIGNVLIGGPADSFAVAWTSPQSLLVEYWSDPQYRLSPATTNIDGVTITFKKLQ
jgi:hypothetical protein